MTGFARAEGGSGEIGWAWEIRSINGRGLDVRCRLPAGQDGLEPKIRAALAERFQRGSFSVNLTFKGGDAGTRFRINRDLIDQLLELHRELGDRVASDTPRLEGLLAVRGVVEMVEQEDSSDVRAARETALLADMDQALSELAEARRSEGQRIAAVLAGHIDEIDRLTARAAALAECQPEALRDRFKAQVDDLMATEPSLPEERLAQEVAVLIAKGDVREELDRLRSHIDAVRDLMQADAAVGRRFDFLCQELNREANTICSKATGTELNQCGLDLKVAIDRLREQVQNIE